MFLQTTIIRDFYAEYSQKVSSAKNILKRPLTFTEKIFAAHLHVENGQYDENILVRGETIALDVDRIALQDATAQMALLQFMLTERKKVAIPTTVHCDHLIIARNGADVDLQEARLENNEVYQFLKSAANKYGIGFWKPGSGIIHQVVLENYVIPGQLMMGTDSHTPNAGGLGMIAIGVGGAEAVEVMAGEPWKIKMPKLMGIHLKGKLSGWASAKDVILKVAQLLTVEGGTGYILEYFGEGARTLSATGKATITNMGAEVGATTSIFPYDKCTAEYLQATQRGFVTEFSAQVKNDLQADSEVEVHPEKFFDKVIEINLSTLEPQINGPHSPDISHTISQLVEQVKKNNWPIELSSCLIGSCTNSSYEDMTKAAAVVKLAVQKGLKVKVPLLVTPGSEQIYQTMKRDGLLEIFESVGGKVLANACGPCIGQWKRQEVQTGQRNSIITSYNRNFKGRNDANAETHAFVASPEIVVAFAFTGRLDENPLTLFSSPTYSNSSASSASSDFLNFIDTSDSLGIALPPKGFVFSSQEHEAPNEDTQGESKVVIDPQSERLAFLQPFIAWKKGDFEQLSVLLKVKGKCTTDHISPAGKWLRYRGHLDKISDNMFSGAANVFTGTIGMGRNILNEKNGENGPLGVVEQLSAIARAYKKAGKGWIVIGDTNYGEGSSREHAAMEPRYLGCRAVIAKGFARIAETNLKQQGLLPLWFCDAVDYEKIFADDTVSLILGDLQPNEPVYVHLFHADGSEETFPVRHTFTKEQLEWFKAGSSLEWIRGKNLQ